MNIQDLIQQNSNFVIGQTMKVEGLWFRKTGDLSYFVQVPTFGNKQKLAYFRLALLKKNIELDW